MKEHPVAALFPLMNQAELQSLVNDIKENGLINPIIIHDNTIIDGRNRLKACEIAGVKPRFEEKEFNDEKEISTFIISSNISRRHLNESQRAILAAKMSVRGRGERSSNAQICAFGLSQDEAAIVFTVSRRSTQLARVVLEKGTPELIESVLNGTMRVSKAANSLKPKPTTKKEPPMPNQAPKPTPSQEGMTIESATAFLQSKGLSVHKGRECCPLSLDLTWEQWNQMKGSNHDKLQSELAAILKKHELRVSAVASTPLLAALIVAARTCVKQGMGKSRKVRFEGEDGPVFESVQ